MNELKEQPTEVQLEEHKCACGCGGNTNQRADGTYSKYIKGHQFKGRGARKANPELRPLEKTEPLDEGNCSEGVKFLKKNFGNRETHEETNPEPIQKDPEKLTVTDMREYHTDDVAWFQVEANKYDYLTIDYIGRLNEGTYSVLVRTAQGVFIPPYLIPGFSGIASVDAKPETQTQQPETEPTLEPTVQEIDEETFEHIVAPVAKLEKKEGFLDKLLGKKEPPKPENPKASGENLAKMLTQV